jgi:cbb3-type cytochrome oxidase subunit 3
MSLFRKTIILTIFTALLLSTNAQIFGAENLSDSFDKKLVKFSNISGYDTTKNSDILIGTIIQAFLSLLGIIFFVLMLYGGYLWMTDRGNKDSVEKAKNVIQAAVIGLAITLISYSISSFVLSRLGEGTLQ